MTTTKAHIPARDADTMPRRETAGLRIAYILKMYPRFSETFIVNEILAHEAAGTSVEIFSLRPPTDGRFHENYAQVQANVTYVPQPSSRVSTFWPFLRAALAEFPTLATLIQTPALESGDLVQAIHIARAVRTQNIGVLHAHFGSIATSVAQLVHKLTDVPFIFTAHAKDIFHESVQAEDLARKLQDAAGVITVSDYNCNYLRTTYQSDLPNLHRIYNGLDLARFPYRAPATRPRHILGVGRLIEKKGFHVLIDACAHLADQGIEFECDIVGSGQMEAELAAQIARLSLHDRVRLLGAAPQGDVIRRLHSTAVFAAPCVVGCDGNRDGLPTVLLEAMALGTPCISTDVTGIPEILHHGETGLQVAQEDAHSLAAALAQLLDDAALRVRLAQNARRTIEADFDIHKNTAAIRALYQQVAEQVQTSATSPSISTTPPTHRRAASPVPANNPAHNQHTIQEVV